MCLSSAVPIKTQRKTWHTHKSEDKAQTTTAANHSSKAYKIRTHDWLGGRSVVLISTDPIINAIFPGTFWMFDFRFSRPPAPNNDGRSCSIKVCPANPEPPEGVCFHVAQQSAHKRPANGICASKQGTRFCGFLICV
jgi:hypothetical protein